MTGHGHASKSLGDATLFVEVKSVNNRFLKISSRLDSLLSKLESQFESIVREHVKRGTISLSLKVVGSITGSGLRLNVPMIRELARQATEVATIIDIDPELRLSDLLPLAGVVEVGDNQELDELTSLAAAETLVQALRELNAMRANEGEAMSTELLSSVASIRELIKLIGEKSSTVADEYRERLRSRVESVSGLLGVSIASEDLLREVVIYADKCDINEELVRLESHCRLLEQACRENESQGRKLDFLVQEFNREANTIGSKANDARITEHVIALKTLIEQMRELVQNVE